MTHRFGGQLHQHAQKLTETTSRPSARTIRVATPDDAPMLTAFAERTFRETFGPANKAEDMDAYVGATYSEAIQRRELCDPARHTIIIEQGGTVIAFAQLRDGGPPECDVGPDPVELLRFYVDRPWQGQGIAQALMDEVIAAARARGARTIHLGVWETNPRAIAFYTKCGFRDVGGRDFILGTDVQRDLILALVIPQERSER